MNRRIRLLVDVCVSCLYFPNCLWRLWLKPIRQLMSATGYPCQMWPKVTRHKNLIWRKTDREYSNYRFFCTHNRQKQALSENLKVSLKTLLQDNQTTHTHIEKTHGHNQLKYEQIQMMPKSCYHSKSTAPPVFVYEKTCVYVMLAQSFFSPQT